MNISELYNNAKLSYLCELTFTKCLSKDSFAQNPTDEITITISNVQIQNIQAF